MDYYIENEQLVMEYTPFKDSFDIKLTDPIKDGNVTLLYKSYPLYEYLNHVEYLRIKNTFYITKNDIIDYDENGIYHIKIGDIANEYIKLCRNVFNIINDFFISKRLNIEDKLFFANARISLIKNIDCIVNNPVYIDDKNTMTDEIYHISYKDYNALIKSFPNTTEIIKYRNKRVSIILNDYFNNADEYIKKYDKYIDKKAKKKESNIVSNEIKLQILYKAKCFLENIIENSDAMSEKEIQSNIFEIISIIFPKYIYSKREVRIKGFDKHYKIPDFMLVDFSGFVDVLEIKLPSTKLLSNGTNRFNYVPSRTFSNAIQQLEKYITCLNRNGTDGDSKLTSDFSNIVPDDFKITSINSQGILIIGNTKEFDCKQQIVDFEIIKRQYRNIIDVYTYDQLLSMINNSISAITNSN